MTQKYDVVFVDSRPKSVKQKLKEQKYSDRCKFNIMINCSSKDNCRKCGWNPKVKEERLARIYDEANPDGTYNQLIL